MMKDLKTVHRWKDVEQVSLVLREMRVWDEDGVPDPQAAEFGEFVLKVRNRLLLLPLLFCHVLAQHGWQCSSSNSNAANVYNVSRISGTVRSSSAAASRFPASVTILLHHIRTSC